MNGDKLPPHDIDAEEAVIGSLLIDGTAIYKIAEFLQGQDFHYEQNRCMYEASVDLFQRSEAINQITVAQELTRQGKLESCGGAAQLSHLISICPTSLDIEHYAQIVFRLSIMRQLISAGNQISSVGYEASSDIEASLSQAESILFKLRHGRSSNDLTHIRDVLGKYFETEPVADDDTQLPYVLSSFVGLDEFLDGFQRSDLIVVAGRPSMGKTSLVLNIARNIAVGQNTCVALFSLEMARDSLVTRLLSSESGVNMKRMRFGEHTEGEERRIVEATGVLSESPIYIDDTPMVKVTEMRSKALRLDFERRIGLVVVDYLQLMQGEGKGENRVQEISYISRHLKAMARELNAPVIAVSQLSRAVESRPSHKPHLADLRESGSIEQDADVVLFIYRDEYYSDSPQEWEAAHPGEEYPPPAEIIIAKNRNGPTGSINLRFRRNLTRFENISTDIGNKEPSLL